MPQRAASSLTASRAEDVRRHARVPVTGLVTEVHASFEHLAHRDLRHDSVTPMTWARRAFLFSAR
jgi:hypothetical protein